MSVNVKLGNGTVVHGDVVVANSIRDSFNRAQESIKNSDLKQAIEQLTSRVGSLVTHLDPDGAKKAADALDTLTREVGRPEPRKDWWELSLKGLKEAAITVKDVGKPVLETIAKVTELLG